MSSNTMTFNEIEATVRAEFEKAGVELNDYAVRQATEECFHYSNEEGRDVHDQLSYIINQAIPDGDRSEWFK